MNNKMTENSKSLPPSLNSRRAQTMPSLWDNFGEAGKTPTGTIIPERSYRLSINVAKLELYQVDAILNKIAAKEQPYKCGEFCGRCDSYMAYVRSYMPVIPPCVETVKKREWRLHYVTKQLFKAEQIGLLQVWNSDCTEALEPPPLRPHDNRPDYRHCKWWLENSFLFPEDLARFCDFEKIRLEIFDPTQQDSPAMVSAVLPQAMCHSAVAETQPLTMPCSGHDDSPKPPLKKKKQRRYDMMSVELHEIMAESPSLTPTQVMKKLMARACHPNSCVVANDGDSVRWEDARGIKKSLTQDKLNDRVWRWHLSNSLSDAPDGKS